jgi:hypothetical protein
MRGDTSAASFICISGYCFTGPSPVSNARSPAVRTIHRSRSTRCGEFRNRRINSGAELFEDERFGNPPRYTADGKLIFAVVVDNQKTPRWYLRIYESNTLRFQAQSDVTEWNPRINRIATAQDSLTTPPHFGPTLVVAPNGHVAAIGNVDNSLRIFDLQSKREIANATSARPPYFFTTDGTSLITDGGAGMRIWGLAETQ